MNYQNNFFSFRRYTMNNSSNTESYETMREYLTTKEAAVMLGLSLGTVQKWSSRVSWSHGKPQADIVASNMIQ